MMTLTVTYTMTYDDTNSDIHNDIYDDTNSDIHDDIYDDTNSDIHNDIYDDNNSDIHNDIYDDTNSDIHNDIYDDNQVGLGLPWKYFLLKVSQLQYYIYNTTTVCSIELTVQYLFEQVHAHIELKKWYGFSIFLPAPFFALCLLE